MCHNDKLSALPAPGTYQRKEAEGLKYWEFDCQFEGRESGAANKRVMVLTDIYGCNAFYQSFATYLTSKGWQVHLIDLYTDLGELEEITREAAFERRHLLRDRKVCDMLEAHVKSQGISAVVGFCLGGNYVLELARRNVAVNLVGYYPFPAGLPNEDGIEIPLDYLAQVTKPVTLLLGDSDDSAGRENTAKAAEIAQSNKALDAHVYQKSGHGFLAHLDSDDDILRKNAEDSLAVCLQVMDQ